MLSIETESILTKLFLQIADSEKAIEIIRQVLADQVDFDPYTVFRFIDREDKNYIDEYNLTEFLKTHSIFATLTECRQIISHFDANGDGRLSFDEYLNFIVTDSRPSLRRLAQERAIYGPKRSEFKLPYDVEYSLAKLLDRELELGQHIQKLLRDLSYRYDFNVFDLFTVLDNLSFNFIGGENFKRFLLRNNISPSDSDLVSIARRFDINRDGRITIKEVRTLCNNTVGSGPRDELKLSSSSAFNRSMSSPRRQKVEETPVRTTSPSRLIYSPSRSLTYLRHYQHLYPYTSVYGSPLRSRPIPTYTSPLRRTVRSPMRTTYRSPARMSPSRVERAEPNLAQSTNSLSLSSSRINLSPKRVNPVVQKSLDVIERLSPSRMSPSRYTSPLRESNLKETTSTNYPYLTLEEESFQAFLKEIILLENEIERVKCDLALRSDFNLPDAFRVFEVEKRGFIDDYDLKHGMNFLDVFPISEDIQLVLKRFASRGASVLSYADFCEMVAPVDKEYYQMMKNRFPAEHKYDRYDFFYTETRLLFGRLARMIIDCEAKLESWRKKLNVMSRFTIRGVFDKIDVLRRNYLTRDDVSDYFIRNRITYLNRDLDLLWYRFDMDGDSRINYSEFNEEVYPKTR